MNDVVHDAMAGFRQQQARSHLARRCDHFRARQKLDAIGEVTVDFHAGLAAFAHHRRVMEMADLDVYSARLAISGTRQGSHGRFEFLRSDGEIDVPHHSVGCR